MSYGEGLRSEEVQCRQCRRVGTCDGPTDDLCPECEEAEESRPIIRLIPLAATFNIGCTECGKQSIQAAVYVHGRNLETFATACDEHAE